MDTVYFELNNWTPGEDYPNEEPFITWMGNDLNLYFLDREWVEKNELCVVVSLVDMSTNFCITAKRDWVEKNCPQLFTEYTKFLRKPDGEEDDGPVYGQFGHEFLTYEEDNIGISFAEDDDDEDEEIFWDCDEDDDGDDDDDEYEDEYDTGDWEE